MARHKSSRIENGKAQGKTPIATECGVAFAHVEAIRQHAAAADAHALAAELHYEALVLDDDFEPISKHDATCASADAMIQTNTAAEASELAGGGFSAICDAQQEANEAARLAEDGEDPRRAHAQAAKHHAALAEKHAQSAQSIARSSQEAQKSNFDVEVAFARSKDAEVAERAA